MDISEESQKATEKTNEDVMISTSIGYDVTLGKLREVRYDDCEVELRYEEI